MESETLVAEAEALARQLLPPLKRRWNHVQAVAARAEELRPAVAFLGEGAERMLVAAAWLHDIGYASEAVETGFHPLDGARYLERIGCPRQLVCLVAHHSGARFEALERGLLEELAHYELENSPIMDALITADMTIGPDGSSCTYAERIEEILTRYPNDSPVHRAWLKCAAKIAPSVERSEKALRKS